MRRPVDRGARPELTPDLVDEGLAREFVNRVQNLRKETGLRVSDRIRIRFHAEDPSVGPWGVRRFYLRDPLGRLVNILSHKG